MPDEPHSPAFGMVDARDLPLEVRQEDVGALDVEIETRIEGVVADSIQPPRQFAHAPV
jgi:hypothetical protein